MTVTASAVLPTTFMSLGGFNSMTVGSSGQATRRMVDLSLVLDVSQLDWISMEHRGRCDTKLHRRL